MTQISKDFTLEEFISSPTAHRLRIDNSPSEEVVANITALVTKLLQPLRTLYGKPIVINSGYRSPALNEAVGGVPTSDHQRGCAADCKVDDPKKLLALLKSSGLRYDQSILYPTFLHLSYRPQGTGNRMMDLKAKETN